MRSGLDALGRRFAVAGLVAMVLVSGGCMSSTKARFLRHHSQVVEPGPAATKELTAAFSLDEFAGSDTALARTD